MGKGTTTSGELVARKGFKRELQFVLKSKSEICGGESLGRTRASTRNLNVESRSMHGKESSSGGSVLNGGNKKIRLSVLEKMASKSSQVKMKRGLVYAKRRMTTTISDLHEDLVVKILSRVPITSLGSMRSTCKQWNVISKNQIFGKVVEAKNHNQFLGFLTKDFRICSVRMDLQGIRNDGFIDLSIKQVRVLDQIKVSKVYHCDGLLLCRLYSDTSRLLVWNPYLGQTRWIPHIFSSLDNFVLGYDNNGNHKILQLLNIYYTEPVSEFKIYEISSNSWKVLDVVTPKWSTPIYSHGVTLKGNAYFYVQEEIVEEEEETLEHFILCFDFTSERFGPRLSLPFGGKCLDTVILSPLRDKQLAMLYQCWTWSSPKIIEIWVSSKIDYNEVMWTKWMEMDMTPAAILPIYLYVRGFFINEENKVAVVFYHPKGLNQEAHIIGKDGYYKSIDVGGSLYKDLLGYFPSLVQID